MPFDLSTAKPVQQDKKQGGFDISTAKPAPPAPQQLSGEVPYSREQIAEYGPQYIPPAAPDESIGQKISGGIQALGTVASGATLGQMVGYPAGIIKGTAEEIAAGRFGTYEGAGNIARAAEQGQQAMTIKPVTETGSRYVQNVAEAAEPLSSLAAFAPMAGEMSALASGMRQAAPAIRDLTKIGTKESDMRMPVTRAPASLIDPDTGYISPQMQKALTKYNVPVEAVRDDILNLPQNITPERAANELVKMKITGRATDGYLATKKIGSYGNVVDDLVAKEALKQGFREGDVQVIKVATPGTRRAMNKMLAIKRAIYGNERKAIDMRPSDVIGESVVKRFTHIRNVANEARQELDTIARQNLAGKPIDVDSVANNFFREMDNIDVEVDSTSIPPKVNFTGSMIAKDRTSQRVIKDVIDLLSEKKPPDALRAHKLKRQLDAMIDFRKKSSGGLTETGRNVAKSVRHSLNEAIRATSEDYARVNDTLSTSIGAMDDFERVLGPSIDLWGENAPKAVGQDLRGLLSNRKSRVKLEDAVKGIDDTARQLGGTFDDDVGDLVIFSKTLDDQFGATARTSFAGDIESSVNRAVRGKEGVKEAVIEKVAEKINASRNINDQEALKVLDKLINRKE